MLADLMRGSRRAASTARPAFASVVGFLKVRANIPSPSARDEAIGRPMALDAVGLESGAIGLTPAAYSTMSPRALEGCAAASDCFEALANSGDASEIETATNAATNVARDLNFT